MKFLAILKLKDVALTLPPAALVPMIEAGLAAMQQQKKEGRLLELYYSPGSDRIIAMLNYVSADQWEKDWAALPMAPYYDREVHPLADYDQYARDVLETLKAAAKMAPVGAG